MSPSDVSATPRYSLPGSPFQAGRRPAVYAGQAMAATSHPAATLTAIETLRAGGNAIDAGVAAALLLTVGEPMMCGIGGDMFALYAPPGATPADVICINGSGRAPAAIDPEALTRKYASETGAKLPPASADAITVPCGMAGLWTLLRDHGKLEFGRVAEAAIAAAENGLPVTPRTAFDWANSVDALKGAARKFHLKDGGAPYATGERFAHPGIAEALRRMAKEGLAGFYEGEVAQDMVASLQAMGGAHTMEDFASVAPRYETPVSTNYRGLEVLTPPPNGQGAVALLLLDIFKQLPLEGLEPMSVDRLHLEAEAVARAYAARDWLLSDPETAEGKAAMLLRDPALASGLAADINPLRKSEIMLPPLDGAPHRETVYLTVVDADGGALSLIFSIFMTFGSGHASERFGVLFHNRGAGFSLAEGHPNRIAPTKRPLHTLIPSLGFRDKAFELSFGVMGGQYQAAGQARFLSNLLDYDMDLQEALDMPRAFVEGGVLSLEDGYSDFVREGLSARGHHVAAASGPIGGGQAIRLDRRTGALIGGSDFRKDGCALGF